MKFIKAILSCALVAAVGHGAAQAQYPTQPVKLIIPGSPGGGTDVLARLYAQALSEELKQPVHVEYKPGGGSSIGLDFVAQSKPDGHTLLVGSTAIASLGVFKKGSLNPETDMTPISLLAELPLAIVSPAVAPWKTYAEMVTYAKQNPGKISYGHLGSGVTVLYPEQMKYQNGFNMLGVAYKGTGEVALALMKNEVQMGMPNWGRAVEDEKGGKVRIISITGKQRLKELPNVPTMAENGLALPHTWIAVFGPKGLPAPVLARLEEATAKVMTQLRARPAGEFIWVGSTSGELRESMRAQIKTWADVAKAIGLKPE